MPLDRFVVYDRPGAPVTLRTTLNGCPFSFQIGQAEGRAGLITAHAIVAEAAAWCEEQFGPTDDGRWVRWSTVIFLKDEVAATAFRLRWC